VTPALLVAALVLALGLGRGAPTRRVPTSTGVTAEISRRRRRHRSGRDRDVDPEVLAAWCESLARAVRGGVTLRQALVDVDVPPTLDRPLGRLRLRLERGATLAQALTETPAASAHLDVVLVVLRATAEHGGPAAEPLDRAAAVLRSRAATLHERTVQSAQARMSAVVMTVLPGAVLAVLVGTSATVREVVARPTGLAVVSAGACLNAAGWWWMRALIRRAERW
jgi:tight adherence protein B